MVLYTVFVLNCCDLYDCPQQHCRAFICVQEENGLTEATHSAATLK